MKPDWRRGAGFTLVEVMVALFIVALALPALVTQQYAQVDATGYLRDKSLARLVASNKLEEMRLVTRARRELISEETSGESTLAEKEWYWTINSEETQLPSFFRMEIAVSYDEASSDAPLYTLVAFMRADLEAAQSLFGTGAPGGEAGEG